MELINDKEITNQFENMVKNLLMKDTHYDMTRFIGGMPVTLESKNVSELSQLNADGSAHYKVTQKVDGARVLLYIGVPIKATPGIERKDIGTRRVFFIDRNMKIYRLKVNGKYLPNVNTKGEILLDGEILFFDGGNVFKEFPTTKIIEAVSFMAFDILYGPSEFSLDDTFASSDRKAEDKIKSHVSMVLPNDRIPKSIPWTYIQRYQVLFQLINFPTDVEKREKCIESKKSGELKCPYIPLLQDIFKSIKWFVIELKPIYDVKYITSEYKTAAGTLYADIYSKNNNGVLQQLLVNYRKKFFKDADDLLGKDNKIFSKSIELDGLIFTSDGTLYTNGNWDSNLTKQFKWKPDYQQTIDLRFVIDDKLEVSKSKLKRANVYYSIRDKTTGRSVEKKLYEQSPIAVEIPEEYVEHSGKIGEFLVIIKGDNETSLKFQGLRLEKTEPNKWLTVLSVIDAVKNPVDINQLRLFFKPLPRNEEELKLRNKIILKFYPKSKLLNCIFNSGHVYYLDKLINKSEIQGIISMVGTKDVEVEVRFGSITSNFNTKIDKNKWLLILQKMKSIDGFEKSISDLVDVYKPPQNSGRIRSRYYYSNEMKSFIHLQTVKKTPVKNYDAKLAAYLGVDLRFAHSTEEVYEETSSGVSPEATRKYRQTFKPIGSFPAPYQIDFTAVTSGKLHFTDATKVWEVNYEYQETFQIEIELLSKDISVDDLLRIVSLLSVF